MTTAPTAQSLVGRCVLVAGGTGAVGEGVVRQLLEAGATVVVPGRNEAALERLSEVLGTPKTLLTMPADIGDDERAHWLRGEIMSVCGGLDAAVASLGGWIEGHDLDHLPIDTWRTVLDNNLTSHWIAARTFAPMVRERSGTYLMLNGGAALGPAPKAGAMSIAAGAQRMLAQVLDAENDGLRVHSLVLDTPILTRARPEGRPSWPSAEEVGRAVVALLRGDAKRSPELELRVRNRAQLHALAQPPA
ncbi:MAG: SDR family oxidoreductase [Acidobacteriota bacterium]